MFEIFLFLIYFVVSVSAFTNFETIETDAVAFSGCKSLSPHQKWLKYYPDSNQMKNSFAFRIVPQLDKEDDVHFLYYSKVAEPLLRLVIETSTKSIKITFAKGIIKWNTCSKQYLNQNCSINFKKVPEFSSDIKIQGCICAADKEMRLVYRYFGVSGEGKEDITTVALILEEESFPDKYLNVFFGFSQEERSGIYLQGSYRSMSESEYFKSSPLDDETEKERNLSFDGKMRPNFYDEENHPNEISEYFPEQKGKLTNLKPSFGSIISKSDSKSGRLKRNSDEDFQGTMNPGLEMEASSSVTSNPPASSDNETQSYKQSMPDKASTDSTNENTETASSESAFERNGTTEKSTPEYYEPLTEIPSQVTWESYRYHEALYSKDDVEAYFRELKEKNEKSKPASNINIPKPELKSKRIIRSDNEDFEENMEDDLENQAVTSLSLSGKVEDEGSIPIISATDSAEAGTDIKGDPGESYATGIASEAFAATMSAYFDEKTSASVADKFVEIISTYVADSGSIIPELTTTISANFAEESTSIPLSNTGNIANFQHISYEVTTKGEMGLTYKTGDTNYASFPITSSENNEFRNLLAGRNLETVANTEENTEKGIVEISDDETIGKTDNSSDVNANTADTSEVKTTTSAVSDSETFPRDSEKEENLPGTKLMDYEFAFYTEIPSKVTWEKHRFREPGYIRPKPTFKYRIPTRYGRKHAKKIPGKPTTPMTPSAAAQREAAAATPVTTSNSPAKNLEPTDSQASSQPSFKLDKILFIFVLGKGIDIYKKSFL